MRLISRKTKTVKSRRFSEAEREVLVGRIEAGETVEDIGAEAGVTENTLRRWCKLRGITPPRILEQISIAEQREIMGIAGRTGLAGYCSSL